MQSVHGQIPIVTHAAIDALSFDPRKRMARASTYRSRVPSAPKLDLEKDCTVVGLGG